MDQRLLLAVLLSLTFTGIHAKRHGFGRRVTEAQSVQVLRFEWENCGKPDAPAVLKTLSVAPDPIAIPGSLSAEASGATAVLLDSPLASPYSQAQVLLGLHNLQSVDGYRLHCATISFVLEVFSRRWLALLHTTKSSLNVTLEKEVAGFWVKIPCLEELGSCHYEDACDLLEQLIPPGQDCPEPLHSYGLPCRCPFKAGSYTLPKSDFLVPEVELPYWLTNGHYRAQGVLGKEGAELGCLKVALALHSG